MTKHMTGTRKEWLAARIELLEAEKELTRRMTSCPAAARAAWVVSTRSIDSRPTRGAPRGGPLPRALAAPRLSLHVRARLQGGVSVLLGDRGRVQRLRRHLPTTTSCFGGVASASREAAGVQAADGVDVSLASRSAGNSTSTSTSRSPRSTARGVVEYNYRPRRRWSRKPATRGLSPSCGHGRNRRGHVHAREAGHQRVRARGRRRLPRLFRLCARTGRPWACTSGSTAHPRGATRRASGGAHDESTSAERSRGCRGATAGLRSHDAWLPSELPSGGFGRLSAALAASAAVTIVWCASSRRWARCRCRRLDDVDGVDADADRRGSAPRRRSLHVGRDDGGDDAAVLGPMLGATAGPLAGQARRASVG